MSREFGLVNPGNEVRLTAAIEVELEEVRAKSDGTEAPRCDSQLKEDVSVKMRACADSSFNSSGTSCASR